MGENICKSYKEIILRIYKERLQITTLDFKMAKGLE